MICDDLRNELAVRAEVGACAPGAFWFLEVGNSALKNFLDLLLHSSLIAIGPDVGFALERQRQFANGQPMSVAQINLMVSLQASLFSFHPF